MATMNPFDILGDDDNEDPSQFVAAVKIDKTKKALAPSAAAAQQGKPAAKMPSKPLPPAQAGEFRISFGRDAVFQRVLLLQRVCFVDSALGRYMLPLSLMLLISGQTLQIYKIYALILVGNEEKAALPDFHYKNRKLSSLLLTDGVLLCRSWIHSVKFLSGND